MKYSLGPFFVAAAAAAIAALCSANTIELQPSPAIFIPAPLAKYLRFTRMTDGGSAGDDVVSSNARIANAPLAAPPRWLYSGDSGLQWAGTSAAASTSANSDPAAPAASSSTPTIKSPAASAALPSYMPAATSGFASYASPLQAPALPCPTSYLLSCEASSKPVACSTSPEAMSGNAAPSFVMPTGAYSEPLPQYSMPVVREIY